MGSSMDKMRGYLFGAKSHLESNELDSSLNQIRKFVETVVRYFQETEGWDADGNIHLGISMTKKLFTNRGRRLSGIHIEFLKEIGNFGSHDQPNEKLFESREDVEYCLHIANRIFEDCFSLDETQHSLPEIKDVVACPHCEQPVGKPCIKASGKPVAANCEHTPRKSAYQNLMAGRLHL